MTCTCGHSSDEPPLLEYSVDADQPVSTAIAEAVAAVSDASVTDLPPLYEVIDTDALDALFSTGRRNVRLRLRYHAYLVRIDADRTVTIHRNARPGTSA